jgi:hypothetical protein
MHFKQRGYKVTAFDACEQLVSLSSGLLKQSVLHLSFQELAFENEFDGVWACASLLHIPRREMDDVLGQLAKALKESGVLYASFKYGDREEWRGERFYNCYDETSLRELLKRQDCFSIISCWQTAEVRHNRETETWVNVLVKKN